MLKKKSNEKQKEVTKLEQYEMVIDKEKVFQKIGYKPHSGQQMIHDSNKRFRTLISGRRWGKTKCAAIESLIQLLYPEQLGWVVAPSYELADKVFNEVYWLLMRYFSNWIETASIGHGNMIIKLKNGSVLQGKSGDSPESLIGVGLDFLIIDEASRVKDMIWFEALLPTLMDKKGWALFTTTPKGLNWINTLYRKGQGLDDDFESWQFGSASNPYLDPKEIETAKANMDSLSFRQEILGEFIADADSYFTYELICNSRIDDADVEIPHPKKEYVLGVDIARMGEDATVYVIIEKEWGEEKYKTVKIFETTHKVITDTTGRIKALDLVYHFKKIIVDMTGLGAGVFDALKEALGAKVEGITFTLKSKQDLYSNLKVLLESGRLKIQNNKKLIEQLLDLKYEFASTGDMKIHHSEGGWDDYTDSLCLASWAFRIRRQYHPTIA